MLGTIAAARDCTDAAIDHLRAAVAANTTSGLTPYATLARMRLANQLCRRAHHDDVEEAERFAAEANATAARLGMPLR